MPPRPDVPTDHRWRALRGRRLHHRRAAGLRARRQDVLQRLPSWSRAGRSGTSGGMRRRRYGRRIPRRALCRNGRLHALLSDPRLRDGCAPLDRRSGFRSSHQGRHRTLSRVWKVDVRDDAFFVQPIAPHDDFPKSLLGWPTRITPREIQVITDAHFVASGSHDHRDPLDVRFSLLRCPRVEQAPDPG